MSKQHTSAEDRLLVEIVDIVAADILHDRIATAQAARNLPLFVAPAVTRPGVFQHRRNATDSSITDD